MANGLLSAIIYTGNQADANESAQQKAAEMVPLLMENKEYQRIQKREKVTAIKAIKQTSAEVYTSQKPALEVQTEDGKYVFVCLDESCSTVGLINE